MTKDENFKLLKIQTCVLKVNIHCDGCKQKVKKLLHRTEGVYQVSVDEEQQKVSVSGNVDSGSLIKKLIKAGKYAELWNQNQVQNQNQKLKQKEVHFKEDGKINKEGKEKSTVDQTPKNKNGDDTEEDEDYGEFNEEAEMQQFLREQWNQLAVLRQQADEADAAAAKKGIGALPNNGHGKKLGNCNPNPNPNPNPKPSGTDQKTLKINGNSSNIGVEGTMVNDINAVMSLAGFHGNGGLMAASQNHQQHCIQQQQQQQQQVPGSLMNRQHFHPQVMSYNISPLVPATTGYCYPTYGQIHGNYSATSSASVFSDENPTSCSIV